MFKKHKKKLILSSLVTLLPIVIGLLLWNKLPDVMATHWGVNNQADGFSSKTFAVFQRSIFSTYFFISTSIFCLQSLLSKNRANIKKSAVSAQNRNGKRNKWSIFDK